MTARAAIFDCDGTLVDGQAAVVEAMEHAFRAAALPAPDSNRVRRIVGLSLPQAVRNLAPDAGAEAQDIVVSTYKAAFRKAREDGRLEEPLYDGIAILLNELMEDGWRLGVATGKSQRGLVSCLDRHGLNLHFGTLQTADYHPSKPDPAMLLAALDELDVAPDRAAMIGDTTFDMEMAKAAGVTPVGVAWGYHAPEELRDAGAQYVAEDPDDLRRVLGDG